MVSGISTGQITSKNLGSSGSATNNNHYNPMANQNLLNYQSKEKPASLQKNTANTSS